MPRASVRRFRAAGATDTGRVRSGNEDRLHVDPDRGIFLVVDGVGGHAAGEVASAIAVDVITQRLSRPLLGPEPRAVREAIALANNEILGQAQASPELAGMTCVLTVALVTERGVTVGHVGDTRLYRLTASGIVKLTHDHSPVGEREDAREISEVEAMRHPRRNEVFRDVGSARHEPEDPDFIEILDEPFDPRSAMLLCSDGLSDMVSSTSIERTVRQYAGDPARVVEALILAANEAGGRDNVTAVYVEGDAFAQSLRAAQAEPPVPAAVAAAGLEGHRSGFWKSRATWLSIGLASGLALGLALAWMLTLYAPISPAAGRTLIVGDMSDAPGTAAPDGADRFASIASAMEAAAPRDTIRIEPGVYEEAVVLRDGVDLAARLPGSVVLTAPLRQDGWVSLTATGRLGNRISGLVVRGRPEAPVAVGMRLSGHDLQIDDVTVEGAVDVGMDIANDGTIVVRSSRFDELQGVPLRIGAGARPVVRHNIFVHRGQPRSAAAQIAPEAAPEIRGNLFVGYPNLQTGTAAHLIDGNFSLPSQDRAPAARRRTP